MQPALRGNGSPHNKKETACLILVSVRFLLSDDSKNRPCQDKDNSGVSWIRPPVVWMESGN